MISLVIEALTILFATVLSIFERSDERWAIRPKNGVLLGQGVLFRAKHTVANLHLYKVQLSAESLADGMHRQISIWVLNANNWRCTAMLSVHRLEFQQYLDKVIDVVVGFSCFSLCRKSWYSVNEL